jgi:hypothetical protein
LLPVHADLVGQALAIFGSFDRARAVAGLASPPLEHDPDVIIGALRSLARSGVRLDVGTLSSMGESGLVAACVDTFGGLAAAAARAGLGAPPPPQQRPPQNPQYPHQSQQYGSSGGPGFAQPPISADGQVSTALALETLQKTALQLNRVPAARDLPPDVARRLTTDYGSVRFAYLALRVHAEGEGASKSAENAAQAASEPVQMVTQEALEATARLLESVGVNRRNVEAQQALSAPPVVKQEIEEGELGEDEIDAIWEQVEREIDVAAAAAGELLRNSIAEALEHFVGEVTEMARHATLAALVPEPAAPMQAGARGADDEDAVESGEAHGEEQ